MTQIGFNLKVRVEREGPRRAVLEIAAKLAMQRALGEIGDMSRHPRDAEAFGRPRALDEVATAPPIGVGHDRLSVHLVKSDILRGMARRCRDRESGEDAIGIGRGPLQDLHAAHRTAGHAKQRVDAEMIDQERLRPHHVGDRHNRKIEAVGLACLRIDGRGARRAHASAKHIRANYEKAVRIERPARAHHGFPPTWSARDRVRVGDMLVAGQSVAKENGVGFRRVESAICLVGDGQRRQRGPRIHPQRGTGAQAQRQAIRRNGLRDRAVQKLSYVPQRYGLPDIQ
jgi:hypothetical protein